VTVPAAADLSYEDAFHRLEEAVAQLSTGGLSLEEALERFEQGMALANYCSGLLDQAELRVQQVGQLAPEDLAGRVESPAPPAPPAAPAPDRGPLAGPARRGGLPTATGPQRKPPPDAPLDPLFDDI
jgi:exodeoxyribonuclease VII small subunit